jgi:Tol biopolymer transport system component
MLISAFVISCDSPARAVQLASAASASGTSFNSKLGGSGDSGLSIISKDGRYILFASTANSLTLTNNNNSVLPCRFNVFLRDTVNNTTALVSVNQTGTGGGNGDSFPTGISTNGQFALFESSGSDLVANDTNNASDIFVRDLINGTTALASISANGGYASGASRGSVMTPDGRYVAFVCVASNLVASDANNIPDVFIRDLQTSATTLVSAGAKSTNSTVSGSSSESPEITPDGRYVVFYSTATNLVSGVTTAGEIYVRDLTAGTTIWASTNARALFQSVVGGTNVVSCNYSISDDGQFVAFEAFTNFPSGASTHGIILRYSLQTGLTDIIHTNANEQLLSFELIHNLSMTPDGRFVAFVANIQNVPGTNNAIYLWDAQTGTNTLVSVSLDNSTPANGICDSPVISSNGRFVAFVSSGHNLVTNALAGDCHIYLRDLQTGNTQLIDTDTNGVGVGVDSTTVPALSTDGSVVVFDSANLLPDNRHLVHEDNMLKITTEGRKAALDLRLMKPGLPDDPQSKVNLAVENIHRIWGATKDDRLTQLVFCDLSTPQDRGFSVYNDMADKLKRLGIPATDIAFIQDYDADNAKLALFRSVRAGKVRILFGSTQKMGSGTNVQERLIALHHLDAPWRPADVEQREGRILRQGNKNASVQIYRYVTEGSFDAYMWQTLETKAKFIAQVMSGDMTVRRLEDMDSAALTYAEVKAIASGNPMVIEKAHVDAELIRLTRLRSAHAEEQYRIRASLRHSHEEVQTWTERLANLREDLTLRHDTSGDKFRIELDKQALDNRGVAGELLLRRAEKIKTRFGEDIRIGRFAGFDLFIRSGFNNTAELVLRGKNSYSTRVTDTALGTIRSLESTVQAFEERVGRLESDIKDSQKRATELEAKVGAAFEKEERYHKLVSRQSEIEEQLDLTKNQAPSQIETPDNGENDVDIGLPKIVEKTEKPARKIRVKV